MKRRLIVFVVVCLTTFVPAASTLDLTITGIVVFTSTTDKELVKLRVNLYAGEQPTTYTVCVKANYPANGSYTTACPVFASGNDAQCENVTFASAPSQKKLKMTYLQAKPGLVGHAIQSCAVTYSIVPYPQQPNYFGRPEIDLPYRLQ